MPDRRAVGPERGAASGIRRLAVDGLDREAQRTPQRRLRLGEAAEPEERPPEGAERSGFARDVSEARFRAQELVREILGLGKLPAIERRIGEERERSGQSGEIADRGGVLHASFGRAERFFRGPRVGRENRNGFLRRECEAAIVRRERLLHGSAPDGERLGRSLVRAREIRLGEGELGAFASLRRSQAIRLGEVLGRSLRLARASRELAGAAPKCGADHVIGERTAERVLRDRERVLMAERARRIARLHECASALRLPAAGKALGEARGGAIVMERVRERVQRDSTLA